MNSRKILEKVRLWHHHNKIWQPKWKMWLTLRIRIVGLKNGRNNKIENCILWSTSCFDFTRAKCKKNVQTFSAEIWNDFFSYLTFFCWCSIFKFSQAKGVTKVFLAKKTCIELRKKLFFFQSENVRKLCSNPCYREFLTTRLIFHIYPREMTNMSVCDPVGKIQGNRNTTDSAVKCFRSLQKMHFYFLTLGVYLPVQ